jgi:succinate dehydrogenase / fumarate reductase cytochrome b subunit
MNISKDNRSLSPHLSIYKSQITSLLSIFHRISGSVLALILLLLPFFVCFYFDFISYNIIYNIFHFFFIYVDLIQYIFVITIFFHFMNGIRHILWDFCLGLDINNLFITACFVLFFSFFLNFFLIFF